MFLVELVMQGVRGFRELVRLRFQSGFNLVSAGNEAGKTTAVDTMQRLLFPSMQAGTAGLVSRYTPDASRGALVVCSDDGAYYRIIQDFGKRGVNLSKYNAGSKEFNLLHKDWDTTTQFMQGMTSNTFEDDYARVFILRREHVADAAASSGASASVARRPHAHNPAPAAAPKARANEARLAELRETLRKAEEAADADYRYQSAKLALDEIKKKQGTLAEMERKKAELEATLDGLKGCETLPENLTELIEAHEQQRSQKMAESDELDKELEGLKLRMASVPTVNLVTDKLFLIGAVLGVLSIIAGVILTADYAMYFQIGVLMSVIMMVVAWYNGTRKNAHQRSIRKDIETVEKELLDLERKSVHEGAAITAAMRAVGAAGPGELKEKAENYRYFHSLLKDNEEGRLRFLGDATPEGLQQQFDKQQTEVLALEQAAKAVAQYAIDTYSIRQDIERIESESSPAGAAWDMGGIEHDLPTEFAAPVGSGGLLAELNVACRIAGIEMETLLPAVESAAQRNLSVVTNGRYVRVELGHDGSPVVHGKDDSIVTAAELSHGTKALIYFCVRAGIVEALAGKRRLPFILDDALAGFDPARQQSACQILRALGSKTQVLLFTSNPVLKAAGDAAAELK